MNLNELSVEIHKIAVDNGFHDRERRLPEIMMLASSELGEAFEAWRKAPNEPIFGGNGKGPEGWAIELIDCIIVCLDILALTPDLDIDFWMNQKMEYNKTRSRLHGKSI